MTDLTLKDIISDQTKIALRYWHFVARMYERTPRKVLLAVWPEKTHQMSIKVAENDFIRKIIEFDTFTKIALQWGRFGQTNCFQRL